MARLFITPREMNFISDVTKELIKDVNGQFIYYYAVSHERTPSHDVYNESMQKAFSSPLKIDAFVDSDQNEMTKIGSFGPDVGYTLEVFLQHRDITDKGLDVFVGDYFSFSDVFYEITTADRMKKIFGQPEHDRAIKLVGTRVREEQFKALLRGPTGHQYTDPDAVMKTFNQQRGYGENAEGETNDTRELIKQNVIDQPLTGPKTVSERGALADDSHYGSSFYDDE